MPQKRSNPIPDDRTDPDPRRTASRETRFDEAADGSPASANQEAASDGDEQGPANGEQSSHKADAKPTEWRTQIRPILEDLRQMIRRSELSQRQVERLAGFSKGYLSQLLAQNLDLKVWHLLAILDVFDVAPSTFFARVFPSATTPPSLQEFARDSAALDSDTQTELDTLYRAGVEGLTRLRRRLERYDRAVDQLQDRGVFDPSPVED